MIKAWDFNVKGFSHILTLGLLLAMAMVVGPRAGAQGFVLSVVPSDNAIFVSNSLTYTITLTNLTGSSFTDVLVSNTLPDSAPLVSANYTQGTATNYNNVVVFELGQFLAGDVALMTVTANPTQVGFITNAVSVVSTYPTNIVSTNVVVHVTNLVVEADLGVTMTPPRQPVITNDWMTYGVTVTNSGPDAAPNVILTNVVPAGVIGISVPNQSSGTNYIKLGTMASGASTNLQFTVEPTNSGVLPFTASVGIRGVTDTNNPANNFATNNIVVTNYLPGALVAFTNSVQITNFIAGLLEQSITVSNAGASSVPAVRLVLNGLTNRLFNAVGTNNGNPFVYYSTKLSAGRSVDLLLQYFPRKSFPFTNSQLQVFAVPVPDWTPPSGSTGTNVITRIVQLDDGNMLIEWPAISGRTYTVVYSDNLSFTNAMIAPPSIVAPGNDVEWTDYGPPTTVSVPTNNARFYRVYENP